MAADEHPAAPPSPWLVDGELDVTHWYATRREGTADSSAASPSRPVNVWDVITRVYRRYQNEVAEKRQAQPPYSEKEIARVKGWLAGVSFEEWFALAAAADHMAEALTAIHDAKVTLFPTDSDYRAFIRDIARNALAAAGTEPKGAE